MSSDSSKAPVVVLDNLRSAFNVGAVFRTAECLGAARLHLCGYTAAQGGRAAPEVSPKLTLPKDRESNCGVFEMLFEDRSTRKLGTLVLYFLDVGITVFRIRNDGLPVA